VIPTASKKVLDTYELYDIQADNLPERGFCTLRFFGPKGPSVTAVAEGLMQLWLVDEDSRHDTQL
jgi:hypothetical protein